MAQDMHGQSLAGVVEDQAQLFGPDDARQYRVAVHAQPLRRLGQRAAAVQYSQSGVHQRRPVVRCHQIRQTQIRHLGNLRDGQPRQGGRCPHLVEPLHGRRPGLAGDVGGQAGFGHRAQQPGHPPMGLPDSDGQAVGFGMGREAAQRLSQRCRVG